MVFGAGTRRHETREMYDTLENILVWVIISCIFAWLLAEAWRAIRFGFKVKAE